VHQAVKTDSLHGAHPDKAAQRNPKAWSANEKEQHAPRAGKYADTSQHGSNWLAGLWVTYLQLQMPAGCTAQVSCDQHD
jgi:hypothetical protein